jgi:tetratricopeptide (TPR) repeat protein
MGHETSIASTFLRSIKEVGSEGLDFLWLASRLAVAPIPASLVLSVFREADGLDEISGNRLATFAMHGAEELSLAERVEGDDAAFLVHTLISRTIRFRDTMPERSNQLRAAAVSVLTDEFRKKAGDPRTHHALEPTVVHARELASRDEDIKTADLISWVGWYDYVRGAYKFAENLWRREWEIRSRILGDQGDLAGARKLQEQVLEIRRRILGEEHPDTITSMGNLAATLQAQGDLAGAQKLQEQVLEIMRRILGEEHPNTLTSMSNLAVTLSDQGDLVGARKLQEQVLGIRRRILGEEHPGTLTSILSLAATFWAQGDLVGARKLQEQVLEIMRRILGEEHPSTSISAWNLFSTYTAMGDSVGARTVLKNDLIWLLGRDFASLGANQQKIRKMIFRI